MSSLRLSNTFTTKDVISELRVYAPTLLTILQSASNFNKEGNAKYTKKAEGNITMAVACIFRLRSQQMSAMQNIIGTILYDSGAKKNAYTRLSRLGVTLSHQSQRRKALSMAQNYDRPVLEWKHSLQRCLTPTVTCKSDNEDAFYQSSEATVLFDLDHQTDSTLGTVDESSEDEQHTAIYMTTTDEEEEEFDVPQLASLGLLDSQSFRSAVQIVGDNLDLEIKTRDVTLSKRDKSLHWFHLVDTVERAIAARQSL